MYKWGTHRDKKGGHVELCGKNSGVILKIIKY